MLYISDDRAIPIPQKVFVETADESKTRSRILPLRIFREEGHMIVYLSSVFHFFELVFYETYGFPTLSLPESTPPGEIIDSRATMSTHIHASKFGELFFVAHVFAFSDPFIEEDECLFFRSRRSETDESTSGRVAGEMIHPLCLHRDATRFESGAELCTGERFASAKFSFHDLHCSLRMSVGDAEEFTTLRESRKCLARTEGEHPSDMARIHIVERPTHGPSADDRPVSAGIAYHLFCASLDA